MTQQTLPAGRATHHRTRVTQTQQRPGRPWTATCTQPGCPWTHHSHWHRIALLLATAHTENHQ